MVERKIELRRRRSRRQKLLKLKAKLAKVKDHRDRDTIVQKIHRISPWWHEAKPEGKLEAKAEAKAAK
jgi:hypothetical protein